MWLTCVCVWGGWLQLQIPAVDTFIKRRGSRVWEVIAQWIKYLLHKMRVRVQIPQHPFKFQDRRTPDVNLRPPYTCM